MSIIKLKDRTACDPIPIYHGPSHIHWGAADSFRDFHVDLLQSGEHC
jgi:hypothetical protein